MKVRDFREGDTAYTVVELGRQYSPYNTYEIYPSRIASVGRRYLSALLKKDGDFVYEIRYTLEREEYNFLSEVEPFDSRRHKLFKTKQEADDFVARKQLVFWVGKEVDKKNNGYRFADSLSLEALRKIKEIVEEDRKMEDEKK